MTRRADPEEAARYRAAGWWSDEALSDHIRRHVASHPDGDAFASEHDRMTWADYDTLADRIAGTLLGLGIAAGERVAVLLPDGPLVHAAFVGAERAGVVVMGIGHRAGEAEIDHLVTASGARALVTAREYRGEPAGDLAARLRGRHPHLGHHVVVDGTATEPDLETTPPTTPLAGADLSDAITRRRLGPDDVFLLNSTSGTTGLPKCVTQIQNRWWYFHLKAQSFGRLTPDDVFMSVVPAPFGFGLWTAHFTPTYLGAPCLVMGHFNPEGMIRLIERERVTVLSAVSTQFIMMLNSPELDDHDVSSLRILFTGGEAIPEQRAIEFEDRTGCAVMNFYGSNETGMLSGTAIDDPRERRLSTAGRIVPEMAVRLYDPDTGERVPGDRGRGQPACRGPALSPGYHDDEAANAQLFTDDDWMLMGDIVTIDDDGWLQVVGRTSDFIIRGGKNISAPAVEDEIATHPAVRMVGVVPAPDPVFGERVAAYVELADGYDAVTLEDLIAHLSERKVSKEWYPEHLVVLADLPRASGGKIAKGELKKDAAARFAIP